MNIFSKKPNPKEALRESKREMTRATRGIEKEIGTLQLEEKKLVAEIKRTAKTGKEAATKTLARQLVRLRQQIANLQSSRAQMRGISTHTQAMHAQSAVAIGMKGATRAMSAMTKQMAPEKQAKIIREFQRQSSQMDMTHPCLRTEMMSDAIDDALDDDEAEDETEDLTNQVLDEIGVDVASQLSSTPRGRIAGKNTEAVSSSGVDELEKRLAALRNP
ncbi:Vacuolar sorting-associated protein 2 -like protein [Gossypium arboreum]|uniref:Vacuolar sorting-associated protein 2-like protein n=1 Tax=Gossypium arboreum TaxID=29729 RepID=A0A0B0P7H9_GOSAR|nr:Vacuolar sorting-associated protein 2 -like protein [Gossypium arboreum]